MASSESVFPSATRRHDLDWLRLIAILILLFFHTGMWFNTWGWHVKNSDTSVSFNYWMVWLHFWRMPLLLFISGAGTYMALGKRSPGEFLRERRNRLLVPLIFGIFIVVPPQIYFEHILDYGSYWDFYKTVFQFVPYPKGSFSWHHLWFILYLFVYSLIALPLLIYLRSPGSQGFRQMLQRIFLNPFGLLLIPGTFILISQIILRPYFPEETHDLVHDWAFFTFYFSFFLFGMLCYSNSSIWASIGKHRHIVLTAALLSLIPFYICYLHFRDVWDLPWSDRTVEIIFDVDAIFLSWFTVITVIAYGQHHLNRPASWLSEVNSGLYPFYILHQTVILAIGYYVCQWDWSIAAKFWTISLLTLTSCVSFYWFAIRTNAPMRFLFGVKTPRTK